jgi:hypothetical protein
LSKNQKLGEAIRNNLKNVRFEEACKMAELLGFRYKGGKGSHQAFYRAHEPRLLNFQNKNGYIAPYQAKQLIEMMDKYEQ